MCCIQIILSRNDSNYITIVNGAAQQICIDDTGLWNIANFSSVGRILQPFNRHHPLTVSPQHIIAAAVLTHIVYLQRLNGTERRVWSIYFLNQTHPIIIRNPPLIIMQSVLIGHIPVPITHFSKHQHEVGKRPSALLHAPCHGHNIIHQSHAIKLTEVYHKPLHTISIKRMANVWHADKSACDEKRNTLAIRQGRSRLHDALRDSRISLHIIRHHNIAAIRSATGISRSNMDGHNKYHQVSSHFLY